MWRKRLAMTMLRLVSPPQQQRSRLLQQCHVRFLRSHRRHSLRHDLHKKTNLTTVVGGTFGTPFAACQAAIVAPPALFNLPPLDVSVMRRFPHHTIYLFEFLSYSLLLLFFSYQHILILHVPFKLAHRQHPALLCDHSRSRSV